MKLILSRKGFDDNYGGGPSPILPDGRLVSFPIPELRQPRYDTIWVDETRTMRTLLDELGLYHPRKHHGAHLDPDLDPGARDRLPGWRPAFGQCDAAQGHLRNQGVAAGDVMLFYGTFRETIDTDGGLRWMPGAPKRHVIFGYLEVGRVVDVNTEYPDLPPWTQDHPHVTNRRRGANTIYFATETLSWNSSSRGGGTFRFDPRLVLSDPELSRRNWRLPGCFDPVVAGSCLSRHRSTHYTTDGDDVLLETVSPGQEYVIEATPAIAAWMRDVVTAGTAKRE